MMTHNIKWHFNSREIFRKKRMLIHPESIMHSFNIIFVSLQFCRLVLNGYIRRIAVTFKLCCETNNKNCLCLKMTNNVRYRFACFKEVMLYLSVPDFHNI